MIFAGFNVVIVEVTLFESVLEVGNIRDDLPVKVCDDPLFLVISETEVRPDEELVDCREDQKGKKRDGYLDEA